MTSSNPFRDRVKSLRRVRAGDLLRNPKNWQVHGDAQNQAMQEILAAVGFAGACLAYETKGGKLMLIDGHLRLDQVDENAKVPVLVFDVNEQEATQLLATFDAVGKLADVDVEQLRKLVDDFDPPGEVSKEMLDNLLRDFAPWQSDISVKQSVTQDGKELHDIQATITIKLRAKRKDKAKEVIEAALKKARIAFEW